MISEPVFFKNKPIYLTFIWKDSVNRKTLLYGLGLCVLQFLVFKLLYPFPDFFLDSYSYIFAASANLEISVWPIGYSKFLAVFHLITTSDDALVAFQYFFMQMAALHFYFTICYFLNPARWYRNVLLAFLLLNPLTLYLCNTIASDALFGALTLFWLTELVWIVKRPRMYRLAIQALLLFLCFTIRNAGYYYPLVAGVAILFSPQAIWQKAVGITLPFFLLMPFIRHTQNENKKLTGSHEFSLVTGWQLANNAMYIYWHVKMDSMQLPAGESRTIGRVADTFFKKMSPNELHNTIESYEGNVYLVYNGSPLKQYFFAHLTGESNLEVIRDWGKVSSLFVPFGKAVILHHPLGYVRFFVLPNCVNYFLPPLSDVHAYNYAKDEIDRIAQDWFHFPSNKVRCISYTLQGYLFIYKVWFCMLNICLFCLLLLLGLSRKRHPIAKSSYLLLWVSLTYLIANFLFSVTATINILRYQYIPMYILFTLILLLGENLENRSRAVSKKL